MIILASTSDEILLQTDQAANVDVQAGWSDLNAGVVTPGRDNTLFTTATTGAIVASPAASTYRTVKSLFIRNRSALVPTRATVFHRGNVDVEMIQTLLQPGDTLAYNEHDAWRYFRGPYGTLASAHDRVWLDPVVGALFTQVLPADVLCQPTTANRLVDVRDLQFAVREGQRYWFCFTMHYTVTLTTVGSRWSIYGPGSPTALRYISENSLTTTTKTTTEGHAAYDLPAASNASSAATGANIAHIEGFIDTPTCNGIVFPRFSSETSGGTSDVLLKAGSRVEWQRVT